MKAAIVNQIDWADNVLDCQDGYTLNFLNCFKRSVQVSPLASAIVCGDKQLSYLELYRAAKVLAAALQQRGVGPEKIVGICLEKSPEYLISLVATWMAGGAFLPIDPSYPKERIAFIAADVCLQLCITEKRFATFFDEAETEIITPALTADADFCPTWPVFDRTRLAYVIYTSGSSGTPKGVLVTHSGITAFLQAQIEAFKVQSNSRVLFYVSQGFDASISDIGTTLLSGAALYIEPASNLKNPAKLVESLHKNQITHIDIPPALLGVLNPADMPTSIETIIIGGEVCPAATVRKWAAHFRVVNVYGPTEATVCSSLCCCGPDWNRPLIGTALPGVSYAIVKDNLPAKPNVPGELYIMGDCLARGYLNRSELNRKKFINWQGQRAYRSGDLVVERESGIEFLGRIDRQFKLHGRLIEPAEIERHLCQHPAIEQALVLKRSLKSGDSNGALTAVCVPRAGVAAATVKELRTFLSSCLPNWMIPSCFEYRESLPLSINGKIDMNRLTSSSNLGKQKQCRSFRSKTERVLAQLIEEISDLTNVDPCLTLADLGLDSLMLIQLLVAAQSKGLAIPAPRLCEAITLRELAGAIDAQAGAYAQAMPSSELEQYARLSADELKLIEETTLIPQHYLSRAQNKPVFVTGATGFFGSRLLPELLKSCQAPVYCLVRANNTDEAAARIRAAVEFHGQILDENCMKRIRPICGDLTQPHFGMIREEWQTVVNDVGSVYHCGAEVNLLRSFAALKNVNLDATRQVLHFICSGSKKVLHYASTLSVFVASEKNRGTLFEDDLLEDSGQLFGGYAQSKWAAEKLLLNARQAGLTSIHIYRLGLICGDSHTGRMKDSDLLVRLIRGLDRLGQVPKGEEERLKVDITPVDYAAKAVAQIASKRAVQPGRTYHIANSTALSMAELVEAFRDFGKPVRWVSEREWQSALNKLKATDQNSIIMLALCRSLKGGPEYSQYRQFDLFQATDTVFDCNNTREALGASELCCPAADTMLLKLYIGKALFQGGQNGKK